MSDGPGPVGPLRALRHNWDRLRRRPAPQPDRDELLKRAAECYSRAQLLADAARLHEHLGNITEAASCREQLKQWEPAARLYAQAGNWPLAARCFLSANLPRQAADAWLQAGDHLQAAWLLADEANEFPRARSIVEGASGRAQADSVSVDIVLARCEAAHSPDNAARTLKSVLTRLSAAAPDVRPTRVFEWAVRTAERIRRPDLAASFHAAAHAAHVFGAEEKWHSWSVERLGRPLQIPQPEATLESAMTDFDRE